MDREEVTLRDVYEIVNARADRLDRQMGELINTTNHRLDDFRSDILSLFIGQLIRNKTAMTAIVIVALSLMPVIVDHWSVLINRFIGF
jgi:hypothetical protein